MDVVYNGKLNKLYSMNYVANRFLKINYFLFQGIDIQGQKNTEGQITVKMTGEQWGVFQVENPNCKHNTILHYISQIKLYIN